MQQTVRERSASNTSAGGFNSGPRDIELELMKSPTPEEEIGSSASAQESPEPKESRSTLEILAYICLWYAFSIALSVYNKWMFSKDGLDFPFPVLTTSGHQLVQFCLASLAIWLLSIPSEKFTVYEYVRQVLPTTLASAGDIGLGNLSMRIVTLGFYTMIKSSSLGFVLFFSVLLGLETLSLGLVGIFGLLSVGVFMMVAGETQFSLFGFILVLSAAACSGLRWALTKLLLESRFHGMKPHPLKTILFISPGMFVVLLVWGLIMEGPRNFASAKLWQDHNPLAAIALVTLPGVLAFCMTWSEFQLLHATNTLTLAIVGICKEVATICVSMIVFGDKLTLVNGFGVLLTTVAIFAYHKFRETHPAGPDVSRWEPTERDEETLLRRDPGTEEIVATTVSGTRG